MVFKTVSAVRKMETTTCRLHLCSTGTTPVSSHTNTHAHTHTKTSRRFSWHTQQFDSTALTHTSRFLTHHGPPRPVAEAWVPPLSQFQSQQIFVSAFSFCFFICPSNLYQPAYRFFCIQLLSLQSYYQTIQLYPRLFNLLCLPAHFTVVTDLFHN